MNGRQEFNSYREEIVPVNGLTILIDGIECYGLSGVVKKIDYQGKTVYKGIGKAILVDKNHDLSYYFKGSDFANTYYTPKTFGYEWGGFEISTGVKYTEVGTGLDNTNEIIGMNPQADKKGWSTVWKMIKKFRKSHSDNWFLPSKDELNLVFKARDNLNNLSIIKDNNYWSSSENSRSLAWCQSFYDGWQSAAGKGDHGIRSRLCVQY